jgi:hypothetical protein
VDCARSSKMVFMVSAAWWSPSTDSPFHGTAGPDVAGDVMVSSGLPTVMDVDGYTGRERDLRRAPQAVGPWPIGRVLTVAAIAGSVSVTVVTWPGW